jgi:flagellar motor switch protein FliN/FliY
VSDAQQLVVSNKNQSAFVRDLAWMSDVPLRVGIEVGRLKLPVSAFLHLSAGSVIELKKPAGEPFEISLNGQIVGKGEVIVVEQSSGVRVVEVHKASGVL